MTATLSPDGRYRYRLGRRWAEGATVTWIMLNPSTADAANDDPTIRRCTDFTKRWGYGGLTVVNLFALRATDPRALRRAYDQPIGLPDNDRHIVEATASAALVVAAWGAHGTMYARDRQVRMLLDGRAVHCLGTTKAGQPRHPLYLARDTELAVWSCR